MCHLPQSSVYFFPHLTAANRLFLKHGTRQETEKTTRDTDHRNTTGSSTISAWELFLSPCSDAQSQDGLTLKKSRYSCGNGKSRNELKRRRNKRFKAHSIHHGISTGIPNVISDPHAPLRAKIFSAVDCVRACRACAITRPASNWAWNCGQSSASEMGYRRKWGTCANPSVRLPPMRHEIARLGENGERLAGPRQVCKGRYGWGIWPEGAHSAWASQDSDERRFLE